MAFDGLGMGDDGTFWGGEVLVASLASYRRVGRFGRAPMPGGALAVKKPYRMALGYLMAAEAFEQEASGAVRSAAGDPPVADWIDPELTRAFLERLDPREVEVVRVQLARGLNAPEASSAGRLFDAAASLLGIRDVAEYEAQAAVELELLAEEGSAGSTGTTMDPLPYQIARKDGLLVYDPRPTLHGLLRGLADGVAVETLAARFQETIAAVTRQLCGDVRAATGLSNRRPLRRRLPKSVAGDYPRPAPRAATGSRSTRIGRFRRTTAGSATVRLRSQPRVWPARPSNIGCGLAAADRSRASNGGAGDKEKIECASAFRAKSSRSATTDRCAWLASTSAACARKRAWPTCRRCGWATT